jgi:hypothetical protein
MESLKKFHNILKNSKNEEKKINEKKIEILNSENEKNTDNYNDDKKIENENKMKILMKENENLKTEMQSYNCNFFEELEDLKFRYSKLQVYIYMYLCLYIYTYLYIYVFIHEDLFQFH